MISWILDLLFLHVTVVLKVDVRQINTALCAGTEDELVVVVQDYPSPEISEPIYRMGEKLKVVAQ